MGYNIDAQHNASNSPYIWAIGRYSEIQFERVVSTGPRINLYNRFGVICYCCSYTSLPRPAQVVLITFGKH